MQKKAWYTNELTKHRKELVNSTIFFSVFVMTVTLWGLFSGKPYEWQSIEPISKPSVMNWRLYSAIVFVTLGAFLYFSGFYKFLYSLYRGTKNGWREYQKTKKAIWGLLTLFMIFVVIPFLVNVLNGFLSILFNIYQFLLYIFPSMIITATIVMSVYLIRKKLNVL